MAVNMRTKQILVVCLGLLGSDLFGHEQIVHQKITNNAETSAYGSSSAYAGFIDTISSDLPRLPQPNQQGAVQFMVDGSFDEDFKPDDDPVGGYRSLNHFYDPLDNRRVFESMTSAAD